MSTRLFTENLEGFKQELISRAVETVTSIPKNILLTDDAASYKEQFLKHLNFKVAELDEEGRTGKKTTVTRPSGSSLGTPKSAEVIVVDVSIPFTGYPKSFKLSPTRAIVISKECRIGPHPKHGNALIARFDFSIDLDDQVDSFISQVKDNLDRLRSDIPEVYREVEQAYDAAIGQRIEKRRKEIEIEKQIRLPLSED